MSPVTGFTSEADAYGYYAAHKSKCKTPVEVAPGRWEVQDGSSEVTPAPKIKGVQTWIQTPQAKDPGPIRDMITGGKEA